jgi:hypothetical protein
MACRISLNQGLFLGEDVIDELVQRDWDDTGTARFVKNAAAWLVNWCCPPPVQAV